MMKHFILFSIFFGFFQSAFAVPTTSAKTDASSDSSASGSSSLTVPLYIDLQPTVGYGTVSGMGLSKDQNVISSGLGLTLGVGSTIFFGVVADYRQYTQHSEVNSTDGNFQGTRTFFAPMLGFRAADFLVKFNYQSSGDYRLTKKTASNTNLIYGEAKGWQLAILYKVFGDIHIGLNYETIAYQNKSETSSAPSSLSTPLAVSQFGLGLAYVY